MSKFLRKKFYPPPYTRKIKNISQTPLRPAAVLPAARRQPYPRAHIRSIKASLSIARGMESFWKILQSAFYFHLRLSRAKFQQEEKMSALRAAAARLCRAAILTRKTIRTRASPLCERAKTRRRQRELGNFSRQNFNHPPQNLLCQFTPQFPKISAFRAKPTLLRRDNTARRGIKEAQRFRRKFLPSRLRGRVCFQLSPPPRAQGRRRCAPRS